MTVLFRDGAAAAVQIIRAAVAVPVGTRVPNPRPDSFVRVARIGGTRRNLVTDEPTIAIECWAASEEAAHDLAQLARRAVHGSHGTYLAGYGTVMRTAELGGPAYTPDPDSGHDRYVLSISLALRGT